MEIVKMNKHHYRSQAIRILETTDSDLEYVIKTHMRKYVDTELTPIEMVCILIVEMDAHKATIDLLEDEIETLQAEIKTY